MAYVLADLEHNLLSDAREIHFRKLLPKHKCVFSSINSIYIAALSTQIVGDDGALHVLKGRSGFQGSGEGRDHQEMWGWYLSIFESLFDVCHFLPTSRREFWGEQCQVCTEQKIMSCML